MKTLILLVPMLAMVAACDCDHSNRVVICKSLHMTDYRKFGVSCGHAFWKIDLSENNLGEFPNDLQQFRKVNLSRNSLEHLEPSSEQNVEYLDVSNNDIVEINLGNKFLSLRHLIAARNYLGPIDDFLDGQCNIVHLDVSGNMIRTLKAVIRCAHLSILEASHNKISEVTKQLVLMTKLKVLDLSTNNLRDVHSFPSTLEILDLSNNNIHRVSDSSFRGLSSLQILNMEGNSVSILETGVFATLSSLQSLKLSHNNLKFVSGDSFKGMRSLRYISLDFNSIEYLHNKTFRDLPALEKVVCKSNKLRTLPTLEFGRKVRIISLAGNSFTTIDHSALLTMFSGTTDERQIFLILNNFRGDDPAWSNVLKYFDGECSPHLAHAAQTILANEGNWPHALKYTLAPSACSCAIFTKGTWKVYVCIAGGAEVDGMPWLEAAKIYAEVKEDDRHPKLKRDEF